MVCLLVRLTSKIASLARSGRIKCARKLFDEMPDRDTVAWNTMLTGYSHMGLHQEALSLFTQMRFSDAKPDDFSFTSILSSCASIGEVRIGRKIHALVVLFGYMSSLPVNNSLIDMYGKCFDASSASKVFEDMCVNGRNEVTWCSLLFAYANSGEFRAAHEIFVNMPKRVTISWNIMISGHAQYGVIEPCLKLFREMQNTDCAPDCYTYSSLMNACSESSDLVYGRIVHSVIVKAGWDAAVETKNSLLSFYAKVGSEEEAIMQFQSMEMEVLTQVSWNSIIDAYMKMGDTIKAFEAFSLAPEKNVVTWTSMIAGSAKNGNGGRALSFFVEMMKSRVDPDHSAFGAVLHACSGLAVLRHGRMVHGCVIHHGFHGYAYVGNALVNMYAKCGDIKESSKAFWDIVNKDLVSWNTMLFAYGLHGLADEALRLYENMISSGDKPDKVTFIGLLITCSHSGLIDEGVKIFESMNRDYGIPWEVDHVACMVDMLGRGGHLAEAKDLAKTFHSLAPNLRNSSWETLLGACSTHLDTEIAGEVSRVLESSSETCEETIFVLLSNIYCRSGRWKEAEEVRREMGKRGVKKKPGLSWIEV
ncbi:PREDICTED: pentatricopeptide repeat-containing protein At2g36980, mitochondrial [Tarenaya hassleriana]|uniref:pentatricopeptide repeat-containing protein At2g36980, mitochondrial n=1 Tax=Tarenaya hassleriana TaxID=28532 RepID=UPI00053C1F68|nr:PREDICTED: pentatricopeptide repeat-containing protein At2g36980, mitochondrial [Tarenaya hassleriana]